jgi:CRISPR-associated protein Csm4
MKRECDGDAGLETWLSDYEEVWALSDGFPAGLLPRPLVKPSPPSEDAKVADDRKKYKKSGFVRREAFTRIRGRISEDELGPHLVSIAECKFRFAHNTIDRRTGSTPETGGLYFLDEDWSFLPFAQDVFEPGGMRDLYVDAPKDSSADIRRLLSALGDVGYGRDANLGRGRWTVVSVEEDTELAAGPNGRLLSLSHGSVEPDMYDLRCRLATHFGKAGPETTVSDGKSPFKRPLLLMQPGATFAGTAGRRHGALIYGVHPGRPEIIHNAFHVVVPFAEAPA